jgi:hypothetical protein
MKKEKFYDLNVELERLATRIQNYLQENDFEMSFSKDPTEPSSWYLIQGRKIGQLTYKRNSTDISIKGIPNNFEITIEKGNWGKHLETIPVWFAVPAIGITGTLANHYKSKNFEDNLWKYIKDQINFLKNSTYTSAPADMHTSEGQHKVTNTNTYSPPQQQQKLNESYDIREYVCDYLEGYPNWGNNIRQGKLLLQRQKGSDNSIKFVTSDTMDEIVLPAKNLVEAGIISRKKGASPLAREQDLMVQITFKDEKNSQVIKPIFNISDDIITGVLAGINELVSEDKELKQLQQVQVITDTKYCINCGYKIPKEAKFCSSCGSKQ